MYATILALGANTTLVQIKNAKAPKLNFTTTEHHEDNFNSIAGRYWRMVSNQLPPNETSSNWKLGFDFLNDIYYSIMNLFETPYYTKG